VHYGCLTGTGEHHHARDVSMQMLLSAVAFQDQPRLFRKTSENPATRSNTHTVRFARIRADEKASSMKEFEQTSKLLSHPRIKPSNPQLSGKADLAHVISLKPSIESRTSHLWPPCNFLRTPTESHSMASGQRRRSTRQGGKGK
jgi:hypothetical protein